MLLQQSAAMKLTFRTITGKTFALDDVSGDMKVGDLKAQVEAAQASPPHRCCRAPASSPGCWPALRRARGALLPDILGSGATSWVLCLPVQGAAFPKDQMKLVYKGKVLEDDAKPVTDYDVSEAGFLVVFIQVGEAGGARAPKGRGGGGGGGGAQRDGAALVACLPGMSAQQLAGVMDPHHCQRAPPPSHAALGRRRRPRSPSQPRQQLQPHQQPPPTLLQQRPQHPPPPRPRPPRRLPQQLAMLQPQPQAVTLQATPTPQQRPAYWLAPHWSRPWCVLRPLRNPPAQPCRNNLRPGPPPLSIPCVPTPLCTPRLPAAGQHGGHGLPPLRGGACHARCIQQPRPCGGVPDVRWGGWVGGCSAGGRAWAHGECRTRGAI